MAREIIKDRVLLALEAGPRTSADIARVFSLRHGAVSNALMVMCRMGVLRRMPAGRDGVGRKGWLYSIERPAVAALSVPAIPPHLETSPVAVSSKKTPWQLTNEGFPG